MSWPGNRNSAAPGPIEDGFRSSETRMNRFARPALAALCCVGAALSAQAGSIEVSYDADAAYSDAGQTAHERAATLATLAATLTALGERLPAATPLLRVTLLDVDRAGTVRPVGRTAQP